MVWFFILGTKKKNALEKRKILGVSKNRGTPKSSILIGFSIINHPCWGIPIFGNTHFGCLAKALLFDNCLWKLIICLRVGFHGSRLMGWSLWPLMDTLLKSTWIIWDNIVRRATKTCKKQRFESHCNFLEGPPQIVFLEVLHKDRYEICCKHGTIVLPTGVIFTLARRWMISFASPKLSTSLICPISV